MIASKIGTTKSYYSLIENGKKVGTVKFWIRLQEALCLSNEEVFEYLKEGVNA